MKESNILLEKSVSINDENNPVPAIYIEEFNFNTASNFVKALSVYEGDDTVKEIVMYVSSYGGEVQPLLTMLDAMLSCSKPIHSVVLGTAASCGAFLSIAATGNRFIGKNSSLHVHHVRTVLDQDLPGFKQEIKSINKIETKLFKIMSQRSGVSVKEIKKKLKEETREWYCQANEALEWGFVDYIGVPKISSSIVIKYEF